MRHHLPLPLPQTSMADYFSIWSEPKRWKNRARTKRRWILCRHLGAGTPFSTLKQAALSYSSLSPALLLLLLLLLVAARTSPLIYDFYSPPLDSRVSRQNLTPAPIG